MKDVTRIRIAKVSYDIELGAKKQLEGYIQALSLYAEDENVLEDIEIRITELLSERGVGANDVISSEDVAALREILGEPKNFSGEGDIAIGDDEGVSEIGSRRKWYRDIDRAVLGGVLSGLGQYLNVNPLWVRLGFIALLFVTFGLATFVYIALWLLLPAAVTVTEKLQARGEPVTLAAIRRQSEGDEGVISTQDRVKARRRAFGITVGVLGISAAVSSVLIIAFSVYYYGWSPYFVGRFAVGQVAASMFIASGVLLVLLCVIIAYAGFMTRVTKRLVVIAVVTIILGIGTFATGFTMVAQQYWKQNQIVQESIKERAVTLPTTFSQAKKLVVSGAYLTLNYHVSDEYRAVLTSVPDDFAEIKITDGVAEVTLSNASPSAFYTQSPLLEIYGPRLDEVSVSQSAVEYYAEGKQSLVAESKEGGRAVLYGTYDAVTLNTGEGGLVYAAGANIADVTTNQTGGTISLGNIASLNATQPTTCAIDVRALLTLMNSATGQITYNGTVRTTDSINTTCGDFEKSEENSYYSDY